MYLQRDLLFLEKQPTPRKGTETRRPGSRPHIRQKQPTPRKGAETNPLIRSVNTHRKQPTPRKGTETQSHHSVPSKCRNNPHPARGRKQALGFNASATRETTHTPQGDGNAKFVILLPSCMKQPTPRKGTETRLLVGMSLGVLETTHTPQGDGNLASTISSAYFARNNPHPARGRKPCAPAEQTFRRAKQPTPRKGTETLAMSMFC